MGCSLQISVREIILLVKGSQGLVHVCMLKGICLVGMIFAYGWIYEREGGSRRNSMSRWHLQPPCDPRPDVMDD